MQTENRKFRRITVPCKISVSSSDGGKVFNCHTENISAGGIMIITEEELSSSSPVDLELSLWHSSKPLKCKGKVAWMNEVVPKEVKPRLFNMGIEFVDISDSDRDAVSKFVNFISTMDR